MDWCAWGITLRQAGGTLSRSRREQALPAQEAGAPQSRPRSDGPSPSRQGPAASTSARAGCWRCLGYGGQGRTLHRGLPGGRTLGRSSAAGFPVGAGSPMSSWGNVLAAHATTGPQRSQILELLTSFRDLSLRAALTASARERRRRIRRQGRRAFRPRRRARGKGRSTTTRRAIRAAQRVTRGGPPGPRRADRRA